MKPGEVSMPLNVWERDKRDRSRKAIRTKLWSSSEKKHWPCSSIETNKYHEGPSAYCIAATIPKIIMLYTI